MSYIRYIIIDKFIIFLLNIFNNYSLLCVNVNIFWFICNYNLTIQLYVQIIYIAGGMENNNGLQSRINFHVKALQLNFTFLFLSAIMAKVIGRDMSQGSTKGSTAGEVRFQLNVQAVFKKSIGQGGALRQTPVILVVPTKDLECRCPRIKINK